MKVIFADIEGVLICPGYKLNLKPSIIDSFNHILRSTGASVVIAGDIRITNTIAEIKLFLAEQGILASSIIGVTPNFKLGYNYRDREISSWIKDHQGEIESFVILDDDDCNRMFNGRLVQTDFEEGLTRENAEQAISILESPLETAQ